MRLFGILLIVANLIAGGAFVYLATQDYKGRQEISAGVVRHLLVLQGLPLEGSDLSADPEAEIPFVVEQGGGATSKTISRGLLQSYFKTAMGSPNRPAGAVLSVLAKDADAREGGVPTMVTNQLAEVKRVQALLDTEYRKEGLSTEDKITLVSGWLFFQAESYDLRATYQALIATTRPDGSTKPADERGRDAEKLKELLDARFKAVLDPSVKPTDAAAAAPELPDFAAAEAELRKQRKALTALRAEEDPLATAVAKATEAGTPDEALRKQLDAKRREINGDPNGATDEAKKGQQGRVLEAEKKLAEVSQKGRSVVAQSGATRATVTGSESDRRAKLAHLLVHLDTDAGWQKRVSVIVGMRRYVRAISDQVLCFKDMIAHVELGIPVDQVAYVKHVEQLREQATQSVQRRDEVSRQRVALEDQMGKDEAARNAQQTQLNRLKDQLRAVKEKVDRDLVEQAAIEKGLYEVQREVGLTLEEVYRLEEVLAAVERERFGLPPRP